VTKIAESNDNWHTCPKCGEPVLIDPKTGRVQPCANCTSQKSPGIAVGSLLVIAGIVAIIVLVYLCIRILL
jgi:uncharacterized protein (DUF983 family)